MNEINLKPVATVFNSRAGMEDDNWGEVSSEIVLGEEFSQESLSGLEEFSHLEIIFYFDRVKDSELYYGARHPRGNTDWPKIGIFAQRGKNRPNKMGLSIVRLLGVNGKTITVSGMDAIDGTPVLDIKPVMREFLPREEVAQPTWATELMKNYWNLKK